MDLPDLTPEEWAQLETGPSQFALHWIEAVDRGDIDEVWPALTADLRLALTQDWLVHNPTALDHPDAGGRTRDELAAILSVERPSNPLFEHVARVELRGMRNAYGNLDISKLCLGTRPRLLAPGLELVRLFYEPDMSKDAEGRPYFAPGAWARAASVIVASLGSEWRVAGIGEYLMRPGWPPTFERVASAGD